MEELLEIRVLGPFEVCAGGTRADVGGAKRQALLAMLALRRTQVVDVDSLVDGLWGEELPAAPRNALHHHIARLRAALGEESIVGSPNGYALAGARIDADRFEQLLAETRAALRGGDASGAADAAASALALWRGPALQGLTGTSWFSAEAQRLETLRVDVLEEQFEAALALGEHRELVPPLRSALADNPFRERLWAQLMVALYRSGRQADALEIFQEARRVLAEELGLEPGPELRRVQEAILAHDPAIAVPVERPRRGNLPAPSTSFVGRADELDQLAGVLHEQRLVTLTGPPGVGKSRLAVETARALEHEVQDGVWLVDFARAAGVEDAVRLLARAIDVRGSDELARAASRLRDSGALVILDACEHALEGAVLIASTLLAECPRVRILATSREALHVPNEMRVPVTPLVLPEPDSEEGPSAAVELFLERARSARPGFERDGDAVALAEEIARRVDGLPLAIELAAARVNVLGLAELASILARRAALLREGTAADPTRTALQELVDWSYDLLHGDEKTLLQQLAVHRGGASLASLSAVASTHGLDEPTVVYLVGALADKSIVSASFSGGIARYEHARHRPRACARAARRERWGETSPPRAAPTQSILRRWPSRRTPSCAAPIGCAGSLAWSSRTTISGPRSRTRATRPTRRSRSGSGPSACIGCSPSASRRGGASWTSRSRLRGRTPPSPCRSSCSPTSASSPVKSSTWRPRSRPARAHWRSRRA